MAIKRETLPQDAIDHLDGIDLSIKVSDILNKFHVSEDLSGKISRVVEGENEQGEIFDQELLAQIPNKLQHVTGLDQAQAKNMAVELTEAWLLPVEEHVGQVSQPRVPRHGERDLRQWRCGAGHVGQCHRQGLADVMASRQPTYCRHVGSGRCHRHCCQQGDTANRQPPSPACPARPQA